MSEKRLIEKLQRFGIQSEGIRTYCNKNEQDYKKFHKNNVVIRNFLSKFHSFFIQIGLVIQKEFCCERTSTRK